MKLKTKKLLYWTPSVLASLMIIPGSILKLISFPQLIELFSKNGLLPYMKVLGITELLFVALFLWRRTCRVGLLLLTGYFGGAMAIELSEGIFFILPGFILALIWFGAYLRDPSLFSSVQGQGKINPVVG